MSPFELLVEQLWAPSIEEGRTRVELRRGLPERSGGTWQAVEEYWLMPSPRKASLLLPVAPPRVTSAAATHYRGMRRPARRAARTALGVAARTGVPLSP